MQLVDTHCHIHEAWRSVNGDDATAKLWKKAGNPDADEIIARALEAGVSKMICVGTTLADSKLAVEFVQARPHCYASIGIHPHEAKSYSLADLQEFAGILVRVQDGARHEFFGGDSAEAEPESDRRDLRLDGQIHARERSPGKVVSESRGRPVAIGECGLDYFYEHSPKKDQEKILRFQIELALEHDLPMIFHVRDAFPDFWKIFDDYKGIRGVIHSFSASQQELDEILARGLYVGLNGIMTFTKHVKQLDAAKAVPLTSLLLETDAPFLTPQPFRGSICEPKHVQVTAEFLARLRGESLSDLARITTKNAHKLFGI